MPNKIEIILVKARIFLIYVITNKKYRNLISYLSDMI